MNIYVVIVEDQQLDTEAIPYRDKAKAIEMARSIVEQEARDPETVDYFFDADAEEEGWVFSARYGDDGEDGVRVVERELL